MKTTIKVFFEQLNKSVEMEHKPIHEIEDCEEGKLVTMAGYSGYFGGFDGQLIELKAIVKKNKYSTSIGLPISKLSSYFEEIKD